jgi:phosphonoacetate hydrolase
MRSVLLTAKDKLKRILEPGTDLSFSGETPPKEIIEAVGPPENIYSAEINHWLFRSLHYVIREYHPDLTYISTTDYIMHKYPPSHEFAMRHLSGIDKILGDILDDYPDMEVYITADHGMNPKEKAINLKQVLSTAGIESEFVPVIKDRYVVHHDNLGGVAYLYLLSDSGSKTAKEKLRERAVEVLLKVPEVEEIYTREEAAASFHLHQDRIGDLLVLGTEKVVFGEYEDKIREVSIRSHGSRYESKVPIIGYNSKVEPSKFRYNLDVVKNLNFAKH